MNIALPKIHKPNVLETPFVDIPQNLMQNTHIHLALPKFEQRKKYELSDIFKKAGMIELFADNANLSLISKRRDIKVSKIIHEVVVKVDKDGTEAAAVTAVVMTKAMAMRIEKPPIEVIVDHTFYYSIIYIPEQLPLFTGIFNG